MSPQKTETQPPFEGSFYLRPQSTKKQLNNSTTPNTHSLSFSIRWFHIIQNDLSSRPWDLHDEDESKLNSSSWEIYSKACSETEWCQCIPTHLHYHPRNYKAYSDIHSGVNLAQNSFYRTSKKKNKNNPQPQKINSFVSHFRDCQLVYTSW